MKAIVEDAKRLFIRAYRNSPETIAIAPGRVNLIGGHIDYNGGLVLPLAIDRCTVVVGRRKAGSEKRATIVSSQFKDVAEIQLDRTIEPVESLWANYVAGVIAGFIDLGFDVPPFQAMIHSNVPIGAGLSSSAALEVATATLLENLLGIEIPDVEKALLCQAAEHRFAGVPCGLMDQLSSVCGRQDHLMLLDCTTNQFEQIPFQSNAVSVVIVNSNAPRKLSEGQYALRREQCQSALNHLKRNSLRDMKLSELEQHRDVLSETEIRRVRHFITENQRTQDTANAIRQCDWETAGNLLNASHVSLRDDYEVSCRELDVLCSIAQDIGVEGGVFGSRLTGGGFGGCTVNLVQSDRTDSFINQICEEYLRQTEIEADAFATTPSNGSLLVANEM